MEGLYTESATSRMPYPLQDLPHDLETCTIAPPYFPFKRKRRMLRMVRPVRSLPPPPPCPFILLIRGGTPG